MYGDIYSRIVEFTLKSWSILGDIFGAKMRLETFTETNTSELWTLHCSEGQLLETFLELIFVLETFMEKYAPKMWSLLCCHGQFLETYVSKNVSKKPKCLQKCL